MRNLSQARISWAFSVALQVGLTLASFMVKDTAKNQPKTAVVRVPRVTYTRWEGSNCQASWGSFSWPVKLPQKGQDLEGPPVLPHRQPQSSLCDLCPSPQLQPPSGLTTYMSTPGDRLTGDPLNPRCSCSPCRWPAPHPNRPLPGTSSQPSRPPNPLPSPRMTAPAKIPGTFPGEAPKCPQSVSPAPPSLVPGFTWDSMTITMPQPS